ncbi:NmrA family NAD(P)-binding protein [Sphingomonas sp. UYP23]
MAMSELVLAVGANGKFAGHVVPALVARGAKVRGMIRNPEHVGAVKRAGASDVSIGDLTNHADITRALKGVSSVFYIAPAFIPDEVKVGQAMVRAAAKAGVRRFVFSSVIHPVLSKLSNHAAKAFVEEALLDSGMEFTFLHPTLFFQNYAAIWARTVETGVLAEPWSTETRFSRVDYRDVAEVAAIALTEDRLLNGTFELCAKGELDRHDVAALVGDVAGRVIRAEKIDPATLGEEAAPLLPMFQHYDARGLVGNPLILRAILGRAPRTLRDYFVELSGESAGKEMVS